MLREMYNRLRTHGDDAGLAALAPDLLPVAHLPEWADVCNCVGVQRAARARSHDELIEGHRLISGALQHTRPRSVEQAKIAGNLAWVLQVLGFWRESFSGCVDWFNTRWDPLPPEYRPNIRWMMALCSMHLGRLSDSLTYWQVAADEYSGVDAGRLSGVVVGWASTLAYLRRDAEALAILESVPCIPEYRPHAMAVRGAIALLMGRPAEALRSAARAAELLRNPSAFGTDRWAAAEAHRVASRAAGKLGLEAESEFHLAAVRSLTGTLPRSALLHGRPEEIERGGAREAVLDSA